MHDGITQWNFFTFRQNVPDIKDATAFMATTEKTVIKNSSFYSYRYSNTCDPSIGRY